MNSSCNSVLIHPRRVLLKVSPRKKKSFSQLFFFKMKKVVMIKNKNNFPGQKNNFNVNRSPSLIDLRRRVMMSKGTESRYNSRQKEKTDLTFRSTLSPLPQKDEMEQARMLSRRQFAMEDIEVLGGWLLKQSKVFFFYFTHDLFFFVPWSEKNTKKKHRPKCSVFEDLRKQDIFV